MSVKIEHAAPPKVLPIKEVVLICDRYPDLQMLVRPSSARSLGPVKFGWGHNGMREWHFNASIEDARAYANAILDICDQEEKP